MINTSLFVGIFASMLHVISGPDHLAAVTPLVVDTKHKAWKIGLSWGLGHLTGMLAIGLLFFVFKDFIPVEKISKYSEQFVGFLLIFIGVWVFRKFLMENKKHSHPHIHIDTNPYIHIHKHEHNILQEHRHTHTEVIKQNIYSSFGIGVFHGLAGVSHFILFLPVLSFGSSFEGVQYIIGFAIGTVVAMTTYAFVISRLVGFSKKHTNKNVLNGIRLTGGVFAIVIGIYWVVTNPIV